MSRIIQLLSFPEMRVFVNYSDMDAWSVSAEVIKTAIALSYALSINQSNDQIVI
jgi:hypothetical protein